jgi:putative transposase
VVGGADVPVLEVSRSGFYDWEARQPSQRDVTDRLLAAEIEAIWECSARTYGAPRVHAWLRRQGYRVARKRVARIMRERGWSGQIGRVRVRTTRRDKTAAPAPDLVCRAFNPDAPDQLSGGDVAYLRTQEGWLYLATVIGNVNSIWPHRASLIWPHPGRDLWLRRHWA